MFIITGCVCSSYNCVCIKGTNPLFTSIMDLYFSFSLLKEVNINGKKMSTYTCQKKTIKITKNLQWSLCFRWYESTCLQSSPYTDCMDYSCWLHNIYLCQLLPPLRRYANIISQIQVWYQNGDFRMKIFIFFLFL